MPADPPTAEVMALGSTAWIGHLRAGAAALGVEVGPEAAARMARHAEAMIQWNRRVNLTAITDPAEVAVKHFVDSAAAVLRVDSGDRVLDIGSGAGFPGLVIKLLVPDSTVTLVDAVRKKASFLAHVIGLLGLSGIQARHVRAEDLAAEADRWDRVVCRAVADLPEIIRLARPLLAPGGRIIALKGRLSDAELAGAREIADGPVETVPYRLPGLGDRRTLVIHAPSSRSGGSAPAQEKADSSDSPDPREIKRSSTANKPTDSIRNRAADSESA